MDTEAAYTTFQRIIEAYKRVDTDTFHLFQSNKDKTELLFPIQTEQLRLLNQGLRDWVLLSMLFAYGSDQLLIQVFEFSSAFDLDFSGNIQRDELIRGLE